jgi:predicted kinase
MLIILAGLPGTGKSTLARALRDCLKGHILDKDIVRDAMFGPDRITFTTEQDDRVMETILHSARDILVTDSSKTVLIDGRVFSRNSQLKRVTDFADGIPTPWVVIECICSDHSAKLRLAADYGKHIAANRTPDLYDRIKPRFQPIPQPKTVIDTDLPIRECVASALAAIRSK